MRLPDDLIQEKVFERLAGIDGLPILDEIKPGQPLPYATIGEIACAEAEITTKTRPVYDVEMEIFILSDDPGFKKASDFGNEILSRLSQSPLDLSSQDFKNFHHSFVSKKSSRVVDKDELRIYRQVVIAYGWKVFDHKPSQPG